MEFHGLLALYFETPGAGVPTKGPAIPRLVRISRPGGMEQGENNWFKGQLVRRKGGF